MSGAERAVKTAQQDRSSRLYHLELRDRLAECSSKFHALLYIAGFWNPPTHLYCDQTDGRVLSASETSVVRELHTFVFEEWLQSSLADQHWEIRVFLGAMGFAEQTAFLQFIQSPQAAEMVPPPDAAPEQRSLFISNLKTLVVLEDSRRTAAIWSR